MNRALVVLAAFSSAAACLALEIAIVRLGAPFVGASLVPWSAAIACVLLGLSLGHMLSARVAEDSGAMRLALALAWLFAAGMTFLGPLMLGAMDEQGIFREPLPPTAPFLVAGLAFLPSLAAGFAGPLCMRLAILADPARRSRSIGAVYAASALGSVTGTALTGFILLDLFGATGVVRWIAGLWLLLAVVITPWRDDVQANGWRPTLSGLAAVSLLGGVFALLSSSGNTICRDESRYNCIRFFDRPTPGESVMRTIMLDEAVHSASDRSDPRRLPLPYAAMVDSLARSSFGNRDDATALLVGGGGASLARAWAAREPQVSVTVAELDAKVAAAAARDLWADSPSITTRIGDGRAVLRALPASARFDVILLDAYRTYSVPPHLVTLEFNALAATHLREDGVFLSNVIDRAEAPALAVSVARTLLETFARVDVWSEPDARGLTNLIVAAWRNPERAPAADTLTVQASRIDPDGVARPASYTWTRTGAGDFIAQYSSLCSLVLTDDRAPVERLLAGRMRC